jgi:alpha-1,3-glucosyltransferase
MVLTSPLLILIDHGHFQYNCVALGLSMWAAYMCAEESLIIGSILFAVALNFKQMTLYYALAFFAFILGKLAIASELKSEVSLKVL